jgi:ribosomal protein S27AE
MGEQKQRREDRRLRRNCPSCGGKSLIRGCRVPGVQLQIVRDDGGQKSEPIALYSDVCVDCGLTSFYARRGEVATEVRRLEVDPSQQGQEDASG